MLLDRTDREELADALHRAASREGLRQLLERRLGLDLSLFTLPDASLEAAVRSLIDAAVLSGWTAELVRAAFEEWPDDVRLAGLACRLGLAPSVRVSHGGGEAVGLSVGDEDVAQTLAPDRSEFDVGRWRAGLVRVAAQVCRVEISGSAVGTGFLVGPDVVLTCSSVLKSVWTGSLLPSSVGCRFGYEVVGGRVRPGVVVGLAYDWRIDVSPSTLGEASGRPDEGPPSPDELDYILVRLKRPAGQEPANAQAPAGPARGWLVVPPADRSANRPADPPLLPDAPVLVAQYPSSGPSQALLVTVDTRALLAPAGPGGPAAAVRVRYRTATEYGSAGAPVFDLDWRLLAVNQMREPVFDRPAAYSQGIPIAAIRDRHVKEMARQGKPAAFAAAAPPVTTVPASAPSAPSRGPGSAGESFASAESLRPLATSRGPATADSPSVRGQGEFHYAAPVVGLFTGRTFPEREVRFSAIHGSAVFEGDIILGKVQDLVGGGFEGIGIRGAGYRWPGGVVPYRIDPELYNPDRVTKALAHWEKHTRIRFRERTGEANFVTFRNGWGCSSAVGMQGGEQFITLESVCQTGNVIHEIGHTVGLWHEQSRKDRDEFIVIVFSNISPEALHNFEQHLTDGDDVGEYDYESIMHYPEIAFAVDPGKPTIRVKRAGAVIGQRERLSAGDIAAVAALYPDAPGG